MIIPDVNVLVYAFKEVTPHHAAYRTWLLAALDGDEGLGLLDPVLTGFVRIVTHPKVFQRPAPTTDALAFVEALRLAPGSRELRATDASWGRLAGLARTDRALRGNLAPDAFLASVALAQGGRIATADRGYARFDGLRFFDPLDEQG
ncbi:MAG: TA system VapC family ribonuclease toxin [Actinomycetota bacterium]